jgi:hypothetical protein
MSILRALAERLDAAHAALLSMRGAVEAGRPWPLATAFGIEPEASWGPPELLAHVTEMLPFWLGEVERVLDGPTEPVPFGRTASDSLRLGVIERDRRLPPSELFARLTNGVGRWAERLARLSPEEAARRGVHPTAGEFTVQQIAERFVVGHLEDHRDQLATILGRDAD